MFVSDAGTAAAAVLPGQQLVLSAELLLPLRLPQATDLIPMVQIVTVLVRTDRIVTVPIPMVLVRTDRIVMVLLVTVHPLIPADVLHTDNAVQVPTVTRIVIATTAAVNTAAQTTMPLTVDVHVPVLPDPQDTDRVGMDLQATDPPAMDRVGMDLQATDPPAMVQIIAAELAAA